MGTNVVARRLHLSRSSALVSSQSRNFIAESDKAHTLASQRRSWALQLDAVVELGEDPRDVGCPGQPGELLGYGYGFKEDVGVGFER